LRCPNPGPRRVVPGPAFPPLWRRQHVGFHLHGAEAGSAIQTWKIFLRNHVVASIDLFVVPTMAYQQLFAFLILGHRRRLLLWFAVTQNPTAEWLAP
jgi:hypothetical protein